MVSPRAASRDEFPATADAVIVGAGIAGLAAAHELAVGRGLRDVVIVDDRPPLTLTSDKSTECYRNWWPDEAMAGLMNRSIDRLEDLAAETGNAFALNRASYAYCTARPEGVAEFERQAARVGPLAGGVRRHRGAGDDPTYPPLATEPRDFDRRLAGADLILDPRRLRRDFPFLDPGLLAVLQPRRCGWLAAQQLGMVLLERARDRGLRLVRAACEGIVAAGDDGEAPGFGGRVAGVRVRAPGGADHLIATRRAVLAPGPLLPRLLERLGAPVPLSNELHAKIFFDDFLGLVPRELPLMIWSDPLRLEWSAAERADLEADPAMRWLLDELPGGLHFRPEGGPGSRSLLLLWAYHAGAVDAVFPPRLDPLYLPVVLRGMARMVPAFAEYVDRGRNPFVDGGYYCKTLDQLPLVGPLGPAGCFVLGALSGYGIMAALGAAEALADAIEGRPGPPWAAAFAPRRFEDRDYLERWRQAGDRRGGGGEL